MNMITKRCYAKLRNQLRNSKDPAYAFIKDIFMSIDMGILYGFFTKDNRKELANLVIFETPDDACEIAEKFLRNLWEN